MAALNDDASSLEQVTRASSMETIHPLRTRGSASGAHDNQDPASSSDVQSDTSSDFDHAHRSIDIDDTPATLQDDLLTSRSDAGSIHKSQDSSILPSAMFAATDTEAYGDDARVDELQQEIAGLFDRFLPDIHNEQDFGSSQEPALPSRRLPALLTEFEKQRGHALIDPKVYTQLEVFIDENPEVPVTSRILVNLIHALESSALSVASEQPSPNLAPRSDLDSKSPRFEAPLAPAETADAFDVDDEDNYLIRDADSSRDLSRELDPKNVLIRDLQQDLRLERDKSDNLLQSLSDKERKINNLEHKLNTLQEQHEETMLEQQTKIEESTNQVQILRRDEKEAKAKFEEVQHLTTSYEAEIAALNIRLEAAHKANTKLKRDLDEENDATQRVKDDLERRLKELQELSVYLEECETARDTAERNAMQLKQDLDKALADGTRLQEYREEVDELRTTADKLELELDEARRLAALQTTELTSHRDGSPPILQRRLGTEVVRRLDMQSESSEDETQPDVTANEENVDDFIETIIQRRRRLVGKARTSLEYAAQAVQTEQPDAKPMSASIVPQYESQASAKATKATSLSTLMESKIVSACVILFSVGLALGLIFNTSRDIYHVNQYSFNAETFRRLNHLPNTSQTLYYDSKYPRAVIASNFVDEYLAPFLDTAMSLVRPVRVARPSTKRIYY